MTNEWKVDSDTDLIPSKEFRDNVMMGVFTDYDGSGYYSDGINYFRNKPAQPSIIYKNGINTDFSNVAWFNK